jgi:hypothetical protein
MQNYVATCFWPPDYERTTPLRPISSPLIGRPMSSARLHVLFNGIIILVKIKSWGMEFWLPGPNGPVIWTIGSCFMIRVSVGIKCWANRAKDGIHCGQWHTVVSMAHIKNVSRRNKSCGQRQETNRLHLDQQYRIEAVYLNYGKTYKSARLQRTCINKTSAYVGV